MVIGPAILLAGVAGTRAVPRIRGGAVHAMIRAMLFAPFIIVYAIIFFVVLAFLFVMLEIGVISHAFLRIGLPPEIAFLALFASLIGSYINIPLTKIASGPIYPHRIV